MVGGRTDLRGFTVHSRGPRSTSVVSAGQPRMILLSSNTCSILPAGPTTTAGRPWRTGCAADSTGGRPARGFLVDFSPHGRGTAVPIRAGAPQRIGSASSARSVRHDDRVTDEGGVLRA